MGQEKSRNKFCDVLIFSELKLKMTLKVNFNTEIYICEVESRLRDVILCNGIGGIVLNYVNEI